MSSNDRTLSLSNMPTPYLQRLEDKIDAILLEQQKIRQILTTLTPSSYAHIIPHYPSRQSSPELLNPIQHQIYLRHLPSPEYQQSEIHIEHTPYIEPQEQSRVSIREDSNYEHDLMDQLQLYELEREQSHEQKSPFLKLPSQKQFSLDSSPAEVLKVMAEQFSAMGLRFDSCECVYRYPEKATPAHHASIFDRNNVLLLLQLANNQIVGAFTEVCFSSKPVLIPKDNPRSCLLNLTTNHFLYASRTNKTHSCDINYLLFGNWELKLKVGEAILLSDLGTRGDCFTKRAYNGPDNAVPNTRQWIFGELAPNKLFELKRYLVYIFR